MNDDFVDALKYAFGEKKMGCDIHWYSETLVDGAWVCDQAGSRIVDDGYVDLHEFIGGNTRSYSLFGLLAEVRQDFPWSWKPKGFPENTSPEIAELNQQWDSDGHSHSYLTKEELLSKAEEIKTFRAAALIAPATTEKTAQVLQWHSEQLTEMIEKMNSNVHPSHQRVVFWFDN